MFHVDVDFSDARQILKNHGLDEGGAVQKYFTQRVIDYSSEYVPMDTGVLQDSAMTSSTPTAVIYNTPYAHYLYEGRLMVSPTTGSAWAKKGEQKVYKQPDQELQYQGSPLRGSKWVERMWLDNKDDICEELEKYIERGARQ